MRHTRGTPGVRAPHVASDLEIAFVMHPGQNWFFYELVGYIRFELDRLGISSRIFKDGFPPVSRNGVYVMVSPHEYFRLNGNQLPPAEFLSRTIFLCAEQPETEHFDRNIELAGSAGAMFDINARSARLARREGVEAQHFALGYSPAWLGTGGAVDGLERETDYTFLGCHSARRALYLSSYSAIMRHRKTEFVISDNSLPNLPNSPRFVGEREKGGLLRRSKILLNLHQDAEPYFEWVRYLDAVHCGCVVVSEVSNDFFPLTPGDHLLMGAPYDLAEMGETLIDDESERRRIASSALQFIKERLPLASAVAELTRAANEIAQAQSNLNGRWAAGWEEHRDHDDPLKLLPEPDLYSGPEFTDPARSALKDIRLDLIDLRRTLAKVNYRLDFGEEPGSFEIAAVSDSYVDGKPRVSVITPLFNHGDHICAALDSVRKNEFTEFELIIVDDGSTDGGGDTVAQWIVDHSDVAAVLLKMPVNVGLPNARNVGLSVARGQYCFMLDSDNMIYPQCLSRLVGVLDGDSDISFAYGIIAAHSPDGEASHLLSQFAWDPEALRRDNFVDAMALVRKQVLEEVGGFCADRRIHGWEDYDLWLSLAGRGFKGQVVREILAEYLAAPSSMLGLTSLSAMTSAAVLRERHAEFFASS